MGGLAKEGWNRKPYTRDDATDEWHDLDNN